MSIPATTGVMDSHPGASKRDWLFPISVDWMAQPSVNIPWPAMALHDPAVAWAHPRSGARAVLREPCGRSTWTSFPAGCAAAASGLDRACRPAPCDEGLPRAVDHRAGLEEYLRVGAGQFAVDGDAVTGRRHLLASDAFTVVGYPGGQAPV